MDQESVTTVSVSTMTRMEALGRAESVALRTPGNCVAIYSRDTPGAHGAPAREVCFIRLMTENTPEGATLLTTVSRKPPATPPSQWLLRHAVKHVFDNLPAGVQLADRVAVEHFPQTRPGRDREVFAYQFISTEGRNVATWIPTMGSGITFNMGFDGRGRGFARASATGAIDGPSKWIGDAIEAAAVKELDAGVCSERFLQGWQAAEKALRNCAHPDDDGPSWAHEETFNGYIARMSAERALRGLAAPCERELATMHL